MPKLLSKNIVKAIMTFTLIIAMFSFAGCKKESAELSGSVKIAGSSTVYPVAVAVAEEFNKLHPGVQVPVQSTGSGGGFKNFFIPGRTDINNASRAIKDSEIEACKANGITPLEILAGTDAITIVVNKDVDWTDNITVEQLNMIWRAEEPAKLWSDVDPSWPAEEIELYGPTSASGTFDYFTEEVNGEGGVSRTDYQATEQDNTIVQAITGSKYAMGYFGMAYYLENQDKLKALKVNGVMPSIESAKSGEYTPLSRPLFIYVSSQAVSKPEVEEYVRYFIKQTNTSLIKEIGYVPLTDADMQANLAKFEEFVKTYK